MENTFITEFVNVAVPETTTDEQLADKADILTAFLKEQDGFIEGELVKFSAGNTLCFIYRFESMDKVKAIGEKMRALRLFDSINPLILPGSMSVTFSQCMRKW